MGSNLSILFIILKMRRKIKEGLFNSYSIRIYRISTTAFPPISAATRSSVGAKPIAS